MLDFLNEVLMIDDLEPDAYQMGISGKSGAKMKAPDGGKASMKGDFNALHPRYPKGHPQGGKFMPKGSKDQINAVAKAKGVSTEQAAAMVGGKAPANRGKLKKFSGSAGAVGKAQKVLKNKDATPEQRAKAKASIQKAAMKMRGEISTEAKPNRGRISNKELMRRNMAGADPVAEKPNRGRISNKELMRRNMAGADPVAEKPKRGKISNKEIMARNAGTSAPAPSGSMTQGANRLTGKSRLEALRDTNLASYRASEAGTTGKTRGKIISNLAKSESARTKATPDQVESQREKMAAKANYKRSQKGKGGEFKPKTQVADAPKLSSREMAGLTGKAKAKGATKGINFNKMKKDAQVRKNADMFDLSAPKVEVKNPEAVELSTPKTKNKKKFNLTKMTKQEILNELRPNSGAGGVSKVKGLGSYLQGEAGSTGKTRSKVVSNLFKSEMARTQKPNQDQREMMMAEARYKRLQKGKGGTLNPSRTKSTYVPTKKDKLDFVRDNAKITRKAKAKGVTKSVNKTSKLKLDKTAKMFDLF